MKEKVTVTRKRSVYESSESLRLWVTWPVVKKELEKRRDDDGT